MLCGCATPAQKDAAPDDALALASTVLLDTVPFFAQEEFQCGPAALAMVLVDAGVKVTPEQLTPMVFVPERQGSLQPEMLAAARRFGRLAVRLPPRLDAVLAELRAGTPVIVLQNLALPVAPRWHYAVVIGFDAQREELVLHSGTTPRARMPVAVFERTWARSERWSMVALPPGRLPESASADATVRALAALERSDLQAAYAGYAALTSRTPGLYEAWFGLGSTALQLDRPPAAIAALERALDLRPEAADAWNNLALAQLHSGRVSAAREAAGRAVALGGVRIDRYRATLAAVEQAAAPR